MTECQGGVADVMLNNHDLERYYIFQEPIANQNRKRIVHDHVLVIVWVIWV